MIEGKVCVFEMKGITAHFYTNERGQKLTMQERKGVKCGDLCSGKALRSAGAGIQGLSGRTDLRIQ